MEYYKKLRNEYHETGDRSKLDGYRYLLRDILITKNNYNRESFMSWYTKANNIKKGEFQKSFQEKMRMTYDIDVNNAEMEFFTDKTESARPSTILKRKLGQLLSYNIQPNIETFDDGSTSEKDVSIVNSFVTNILNKSSYSKQVAKVYDDANYYGTGVMKINKSLLPKNYYKVHDGISVSHVEISKFICDDSKSEIEDMDYCGDYEIVNGFRAYMSLTKSEKQTYRENVDSNYRLCVAPGIVSKFTGGDKLGVSSYMINTNTYDFSDINNKKIAMVSDTTLMTIYVRSLDSITGNIIEIKLLGDVIYSMEELEQKTFPYASHTPYEDGDNFYGTSLLYLMFDSYILHLRSKDAIEKNLLFASNPVHEINIRAIGADVDSTTTALNIPGAGIPVTVNGAIQRIERGGLTTEMNNVYQMSLDELNDIGGVTNFNSGQNSGSITTSGGITAMINAANTVTQVDIPVIEHFHKSVLYKILQTIADNSMEIKAKIRDGKHNKLSLREVDITTNMVDNFDIVVKAESEQVNTQNALVALLQLIQMIPPDESGITDILRGTIITSMIDLLPVDTITKDKISMDITDALKEVQEKKDSKSKEDLMRVLQQMYQIYGQRMTQLDPSQYVK